MGGFLRCMADICIPMNGFPSLALFLFFLSVSYRLFAQQGGGDIFLPPPFESIQEKADVDSVLLSNEYTTAPELPGFEDFVVKHLKYPKLARKKKFQGTVRLQFVIEKDGSISRMRVLSGVFDPMDDEAKRVVQLFANKHKIIPATYNGKPVRSFCVVPVHFVLE